MGQAYEDKQSAASVYIVLSLAAAAVCASPSTRTSGLVGVGEGAGTGREGPLLAITASLSEVTRSSIELLLPLRGPFHRHSASC